MGVGQDLTIAELAHMIEAVVGFRGHLLFETSKPDVTIRKLLDTTTIRRLGWQALTPLEEGMAKTYSWFLQNPQPT